MNFSSSSIIRIVVVSIFAVAGIVFLLIDSPVENRISASASGPTPGVSGAPGEGTCVACHADFAVNSGKGNISISGVPKNYLPNQAINVTVKVEQATAVIFGFQMTTVDSNGGFTGSYFIAPANPQPLQIVAGMVQDQTRQYIEHTDNGIVPQQFGSRTWTFTYNAPERRVGKLRLFAAGNAASGDQSTAGDYIYTISAATLSGSSIANFDNDIRSDLSVFRPSSGTWYSISSENGQQNEVQFGTPGDIVAPGDYDGDGKTDQAVWRPSNTRWYLKLSSGGTNEVQFGNAGDIPVAADYDGDLKTDVAMWRPSNGTWYIIRSSDAVTTTVVLGHPKDRPVPADYDGDAKADIALYRPSGSAWYILESSSGSLSVSKFGFRGDEPVPGDYDGDGRWDIAVYRPHSSVWNVLTATKSRPSTQFGTVGGRPVPADYDGDGKTDLAVFNSGTWDIRNSETGSTISGSLGLAGDFPIPRGYIPQ